MKRPTRKKPVRKESIGISVGDITLPPDNEHTNAGTIALANAVSELAKALAAAAKALEETARRSGKIGVAIDSCTITGVDTGARLGNPS